MPILRVDQMGNLYASSGDREDGGGYGYSPECVPQGDLTLGAAYLKSGAARTASLLQSKRNRQLEDQFDESQRLEAKRRRQNIAGRAAREAEFMNRPSMKQAAIEKALSMGCPCEYSTPMSGNVMTANGQSGWRGMSRDQQTIHNAVLGMGRDTSFKADPVEAQQMRMRLQAERLLRLKARR